MSAMTKLTLLATGLIGLTNAVKITQFLQPNCASASATCQQVAANTCCSTNFQPFKSATISPLYEDEIGAIYTRTSKNCGTVVDSQNGPITCLSTSLYQLRGAAWFDCIGCALNTSKRSIQIPAELQAGGSGNCTHTVEPDLLTLADGHHFDIGPSTPVEVTQALYDFAAAQASIADIPSHLLSFKTEPTAEE